MTRNRVTVTPALDEPLAHAVDPAAHELRRRAAYGRMASVSDDCDLERLGTSSKGATATRPGWASSAGARASMIANRRRDTHPELAVRALLHAAGLRYRVDYSALASDRRRRADIVFTRRRIAVFIEGCFWHGCPEHFVPPKANADYWGPKIARNRERDSETSAALEREGWTVLRFWEHEDPREVAATIAGEVRRNAGGHPPADPSTPQQ